MEMIDKLISDYYAGSLTQDEMDDLCRMFLDDEDVRLAHPDESRALVPVALARLAHRRQENSVGRRWSVAASIAIMLLLGGSLYVHAANAPHTYCSDPAFSNDEVEQWYDKTLETAV